MNSRKLEMFSKRFVLLLLGLALVALVSAQSFTGATGFAISCGAHPRSQAGAPRPSRERVLYNPPSVPAAQANFLKGNDMVIGIAEPGPTVRQSKGETGSVAKAYWLPMVIWTHFIQDQLGDSPLLVTW